MRILILSRNGELYSTRSLYNAARRRKHFVRVVDHMHCDLIIDDNRNVVYLHGQPLRGYDVIIPRIGNTVTFHGSAVIRHFESMGVASVLSADALLKTRDKLSCMQILTEKGIPVPKTIIVNNYNQYHILHQRIPTFPKIVKLQSGTHGIGVVKVDDLKSLETWMETFHGLRQKVMMQEFIEEANGADIRIFVVGGEVVASMKRAAKEGEFRSNLHRGGSSSIAEISDEERRVALESVKVLGLHVAGVDLLRSRKGPLILEVNASPGLEGIETTTRVDIAKKIVQFAERKAKEGLHEA